MATFNQLFDETFAGGDSNPADPAKWTTATGNNPLQILNHRLEVGDSALGFAGANYTAVAAPDNQYIDSTINMSNTGLIQAVLRSDDTQFNCYVLSMNDLGGGISDTYIARYVDGVQETLLDIGDVPFVNGDVFRFAVSGTSLAAFKNGTVIGQATDALYSSGFWGYFLEVFNGSSPTDASLSRVSGGSVTGDLTFAYSVPDCRVAPFGPNASRTVQGTKIYDVQTTSNVGGAPVDSRAAGAPVDSRVSAPQNSRAPGTFGPGE